MLLHALPKPVADCAARIDEGRAHILSSCPICHQRKGGLSWFTLDAKQIVFFDRVALDLQPAGRPAAAVFAVAALRNHALDAGLVDQMEDRLSVSGQRLAELDAVVRQDDAFQGFAPVLKIHILQIVAVEMHIEGDEIQVMLAAVIAVRNA